MHVNVCLVASTAAATDGQDAISSVARILDDVEAAERSWANASLGIGSALRSARRSGTRGPDRRAGQLRLAPKPTPDRVASR
jgi:hypothetical protein